MNFNLYSTDKDGMLNQKYDSSDISNSDQKKYNLKKSSKFILLSIFLFILLISLIVILLILY